MSLFDDLRNRLHQAEAAGGAAVDPVRADAQCDAIKFVVHLMAQLAQNPEPLFAVLRRVKPICTVKDVVLVTRFEDVQEVLSRDDIFQVTYGPKMRVITGGQDFFLGMQDSPEYERDVAHMRSVMRRQDMAAISGFVANTARQIVAQSGGKIELVNQLSRVVPARWIAEYFGTVPPSDRELADWGSAIFQYLFTDLTNDPAVGRAAQHAAGKAAQCLDDGSAQRKARGEKKDDRLGRCLELRGTGAPRLAAPG